MEKFKRILIDKEIRRSNTIGLGTCCPSGWTIVLAEQMSSNCDLEHSITAPCTVGVRWHASYITRVAVGITYLAYVVGSATTVSRITTADSS